MSDKKAPPASSDKTSGATSDPHKDVPLVTEKAAPRSNFAKATQEKQAGSTKGKPGAAQKPPPPAGKSKTGGKGRGWRWLLLLLLVLAAAAIAAWYLLPGVREQVGLRLQGLPVVGRHFASNAGNESDQAADATPSGSQPDRQSAAQQPVAPDEPTTPTQPPVEQPAPQPDTSAATAVGPEDTITPQITQLRQQVQQQNELISQLQQQIATMQRSVTAQGNRLSQIGNASREDWQLAEADYLLRLANQRLMLEQDSRAALGLVQEVDNIVRDVDLPDLYGVRQQLARDLTALKLVENVDREGLYLRLRALEEQMVKLNIQPQFDLAKQQQAEPDEQATDEGNRFQSSWQNFKDYLKGSVRIRDAEIDPVLLSPQSETRFRQSLRLNMEQAELALLRADDSVYKDALNQARELMLEYGVDTPQRQVILRELDDLSQQKIAVELPNLSASQNALRNYIDRLHKTAAGQSEGGDSE